MHVRRVLSVLVLGGVLVAPLALVQLGAHAQQGVDPRDLTKMQRRLLTGEVSLMVEQMLGQQRAAGPRTALPRNARPTSYQPGRDGYCDQVLGDDVKVNQNCLNLTDPDLQGRGQAQNETAIAVHPHDRRLLVAGYNDYRRGDSNCGISYSRDAGRTWADATLPTGFVRGDAFGAARQYFQAGGDPSLALDSRGNAYYSCLLFQRGQPTTPNPDLSSGHYVFRSTGNAGASWNFPGRPVVESPDTAGTGEAAFVDKQYMTVDANARSPFRDRVYVTWTEFAADGTAYIYGSYSADYGETFSRKVLVSRDSPLCSNTFGFPTPRGRCTLNQFSQPFVGGDGALYVVWNNYNNTPPTPNDNRHQMLLAKSTDGGVTFGAPVKVADFYDLPDCATYQDGKNPGRACVPEKGDTANSFFRAANYPSGVVDPRNPNRVIVTLGSYINRYSKESNGCVPRGFSPETRQNLFNGVKTPGACNNDILLSVSGNGGASFTGTTTDPRALPSLTPERRQQVSSQFWQWAAFSPGGVLGVSYYDRQYGRAEFTGAMDYSISTSRRLPHVNVRRVTSSTMPPPTQFDGLFFGDYSGIAASATTFHPTWMDTRNLELFLCEGTAEPGVPPRLCLGPAPNARYANDQEIFADRVPVPGGR